MPLFGAVHVSLLAAIALLATLLPALCRRRPSLARPARLILGYGLAFNELVWWIFRYTHEGIHWTNLPLQLCDVTVWGAVFSCLTLSPAVVEFTYFAGIGGAGMALLTPDLWSPWPSYPSVYFFVAHGGVVIAAAFLVFGGIAPVRPGAVGRSFCALLAYAVFLGAFNALFHTNFMYLCRKPANASPLDAFGPWPIYWIVGIALAFVLFGLLSLVAPRSSPDIIKTPADDRGV